jgi:sugar lactone lactonase YvrE
MDNPHLLFRQPNELSEGPLWDHRNQTLYWLDVLDGKVWRSQFAGPQPSAPEVFTPAPRVSALGLRDDGTLIGACETDIEAFAWGGAARRVAVSDHDPATMALNDGKVGPDGAFWFGAKDRAHRDGIAPLQRLFPDGRKEILETGLTISNGLDWSPDLRWFYLADSIPRVIWRYRYDQATGRLSDRSVFADGTVAPGVPDGLAVDAEGCLWSARWGGSQLVRLSPQGEVLARVAFPVSRVSSCIFGGPDFRTLFVTTAKEDLNESERRAEVLSGSIFALRVEVPGRPSFFFPR